tara:strand:- start:782 stop:1135 length:354 start_codon:yes stop_codon:yes gene_type:complete
MSNNNNSGKNETRKEKHTPIFDYEDLDFVVSHNGDLVAEYYHYSIKIAVDYPKIGWHEVVVFYNCPNTDDAYVRFNEVFMPERGDCHEIIYKLEKAIVLDMLSDKEKDKGFHGRTGV